MNIRITEKNSVKFHYLKKGRKGFYCDLNIEDITDPDYTHSKNVWKELK